MFLTKTLKSYRGRGQIYRWLRAHHDAVTETLAAGEVSWSAVAAEMASHGVVGRRGCPPTGNATLRVWRRVCDDLQKAAAAEARRAQVADDRHMSKGRAGLQAVLREITRNPERSDLFRWMVEHHTELIAAAKGRRLHWRILCDQFAQLGLADATGKPATPATARKTWQRARAAVAVREDQPEAPPRDAV